MGGDGGQGVMGVPQPPVNIRGWDVKRYHIHFPPFNMHRGNTEQQIECGRRPTCLSYFPSLEGSQGHVFGCRNDKEGALLYDPFTFEFWIPENICWSTFDVKHLNKKMTPCKIWHETLTFSAGICSDFFGEKVTIFLQNCIEGNKKVRCLKTTSLAAL